MQKFETSGFKICGTKCIFFHVIWWSPCDHNSTAYPICHPSPAKKSKCSFLDYVQLLMIGQASQRTQTPSTTPLQPKKWNAHFWIMFNFWWSAGLVHGLELHPPPLSSQKNEMLDFGLHSTSDDWLGWLMDSNPICHPSAAKKMKCSFLDYVLLLIISWAGRWTWTPPDTSHDDRPSHPSDEWWLKCKKRPPKSSKNEMFIFWWSTRRLPEDHQKTYGSLLTLWYKEISIKDYTSTWTAVP